MNNKITNVTGVCSANSQAKTRSVLAGILSVLLVFVFGLALSSCGGGGGGDPKKVVENYVGALKKGDWATAKKLCAGDSLEKLALYEKEEGMAELAQEMFADADFTQAEQKIDGSTATVTLKAGRVESTFKLTKEGGGWKITGN